MPWNCRERGAVAGCCARAHEKLTWQGFDEYMNLVLDDAEEMSIKKKSRKPLGELRSRMCRGSTVRTCRFRGRSPRCAVCWQGGFCSRGTTLRS
jgi:hypothetical protein